MVTTAAAMLLCKGAVRDTTGGGGGGGQCKTSLLLRRGPNNEHGWDLPLPPAAGTTATDAAMMPSPGQELAVMPC